MNNQHLTTEPQTENSTIVIDFNSLLSEIDRKN